MNFITGLLIGGFAGYQWNQAKHRAEAEKAVQDEKTAQETERLHEQIRQEAADHVWDIFHDQMATMRRKVNQLQEQLDAANAAAANAASEPNYTGDEPFDTYPPAHQAG